MADMKKERGMLYSPPMVIGIGNGSKAETRRIVKPQPPFENARLSQIVESTNYKRKGKYR